MSITRSEAEPSSQKKAPRFYPLLALLALLLSSGLLSSGLGFAQESLPADPNGVESETDEYDQSNGTRPFRRYAEGPSRYDGWPIRKVIIKVNDVFEDPTNAAFAGSNYLKINTREHTVKRELLLKEGDAYDQFLADESLRNLRTLRYLRRWEVKPVPVEGAREVDLFVEVQDTWTLIPQASFSAGDGRDRLAAGVSESNFLGRGERVELLYEEDDERESISGVYDSRRFLDYNADLVLGFFDRSDGDRYLASLTKPLRTLVDTAAWSLRSNTSDIIGRLFEAGDERFIFKRNIIDLGGRYTIQRGNPQRKVRRYTFGYQYLSEQFGSATASDFDDLDLDPSELTNDPSLVAENRRFSGPVFTYETVNRDFISLDYIDRFDRVIDYNLGATYSGSILLAPDSLGSRENAALLGAARSHGWKLDATEFIRGEISASSRLTEDGLENSLLRAELRYYNALGRKSLWGGRIPLGRHTLAGSFVLDIGDRLDRDRELLIGADNFIRGYEARTFTGDQRFGLNLEDRVVVAENILDLVSVGVATFFDAGAANKGRVLDMITDDFYSNVGFGLRFAFPRSSGGTVLRVEMALPLRDGPDGSDQFEPRLIFSGGQLFSAFLGSERAGAERATAGIGFDN